MTDTTMIRSLKYFLALDFEVASLSLRIGTKADDRAPSAKNALKRLGIAKAIKKVSVSFVAPKAAAILISLISPKILLVKTPAPDLKTDNKKFLFIK